MREQKAARLNSLKRKPAFTPTPANPASPRPSTKGERHEAYVAGIKNRIEESGQPSPSWRDKTRKKHPIHGIKGQNVSATLPKPPVKFGRGLRVFNQFVKYWKSLSVDHLERTRVHQYRKWPVIDRLLVGLKHSSIARYEKSDEPNVSPECPFMSETPDNDLLHMFGAGEYKFMLNELGVPNSIMTIEITVNDDAYPPQIDYRELSKSHPLNQSFIDGLRRRGVKLPWDTENETDEQDGNMTAGANVIGQMATTMMDLAKTVSTGKGQEPTIDQKAMESGMRIVQAASEMGMKIVKEGIAANSEKTNPIEMLRAVAELTGAKKGDDALTIQLLRQTQDLNARIQELTSTHNQEMIMVMKDMLTAQKDNAPVQRTEIDILTDAVQRKKLLEELNGGTSRKRIDDDDAPARPTTAETLLQNAPIIMQGLVSIIGLGANIFHNYAAMRSNAAPTHSQPGQPGQPPPQPQINPQGALGALEPPPNDTTEDEMMELQRAQQMLTAMQDALLAHYFGDGTGGDTFANWIITSGTGANPTQSGRRVYDGMREAGKDKLMYLLRSHDVWKSIGQTPQKTEAFVTTFLAYDDDAADVDIEKSGN